MSNRNEQGPLADLCGGYFHQDWMMESEDWRDIVRAYAKDHHGDDEVRRLRVTIVGLLRSGVSDAALEDHLLRNLGCSIYFPGIGMTPRQWLGAVVQVLEE